MWWSVKCKHVYEGWGFFSRMGSMKKMQEGGWLTVMESEGKSNKGAQAWGRRGGDEEGMRWEARSGVGADSFMKVSAWNDGVV